MMDEEFNGSELMTQSCREKLKKEWRGSLLWEIHLVLQCAQVIGLVGKSAFTERKGRTWRDVGK